MSYKVSTKTNYHNIPEGTEGERTKRGGKVFYSFPTGWDKSDSVSFSWNYIQNNKKYFSVKQTD